MEVNLNNIGTILSIVIPIITFGGFVWRSNNKRFQKIDDRFEKIDEKFDKMDEKFTKKFEYLGNQIDVVKNKVSKIEGYLEAVDRYILLDKIDKKINQRETKKEN